MSLAAAAATTMSNSTLTVSKPVDWGFVLGIATAIVCVVGVIALMYFGTNAAEERYAACSVWRVDYLSCYEEKPAADACRSNIKAERPDRCSIPRLPKQLQIQD